MFDWIGLFPSLASVSGLVMVLGLSMMLRHPRIGAYVSYFGIAFAVILIIITIFL